MPIIEISAGLATVLLFGTFFVLMLMGIPILFSLGFSAFLFLILLLGPARLPIIGLRAWDGLDQPLMVAMPMFIFMGILLESSGIASNLYNMMLKWFGGLRGGLAAGTVLICMLMAAMSGLSAAATLTMGLSSLPEMLKRGYNTSVALGCIGAGGALGILIPPSVPMVLYALLTGASIGQLFIGGLIPGIILGLIFIVYIFIRCWIQPVAGPALPKEDRATWPEKIASLRQVILPIFVVIMVLGSIYAGVATPTEASALGVVGTIISAAINKQLSYASLRESCFSTAKICGMSVWLFVGTLTAKSIIFDIGVGKYIEDLFRGLPGGPWQTIIIIQLIWIVLGCLIDAISILFITGPIFFPIVSHFGFNMVWFGIVYVVNMEMAYLTPPFGMNLFYLKAVAPPGITMGHIYRSVGPFVALQVLMLVLVMVFPSLVLWLPSKMIT